MPTQVIMPQLGESVVEGTVTKWFKQEGEAINNLEPLLEVETDKVTTDVPATASGTILKITVPEGTTVKAGTVLAWIGQMGEAVAGEREAAPARAAAAPAPAAVSSGSGTGNGQRAAAPSAGRDRELGFISPVVARLAKENNVDLYQVKGSGEGGRITKKDVLAYLEGRKERPEKAAVTAEAQAAWETPGEGDLFRPTELQFGAGGPGGTAKPASPPAPSSAPAPQTAAPSMPGGMPGDQLIPVTHIRRSIAAHMVTSKTVAPHVTTVMEANLQKVVGHREANKDAFARDGANLTYTAYFVAAAVAALRAFPMVNSSWSDEGLLVHKNINVGIAASLGEEGLIVPVVKGADGMSLLGLARAVNDLANRARAHQLKPDEVKEGTFTITNHGISGSLFATPIINQPQSAILGVGMIEKRVVVIDDAIAIRPMVYLSLTFDHRVLDGASGDAFLAKVVETLENWV